MPDTNIGAADYSNLKSAFAAGTENYYSVPSEMTDSSSGSNETFWNNTNWPQQLGYYKQIPELRSVIDAKATWTVGKGFKAGKFSESILSGITGWGKDTFNTILENLIRTMQIGGDSYAEIIRGEDNIMINLKPLDPGTIRIVSNKKGIIIRYEQLSKGKVNTKWIPKEIFHLARNRLADEIHGQSMVDPLANIILMRNEAMADWQRVMHRNVDPLMIFHLDTDDETRIASFKSKMDAAKGKGENMYIPKDAVVPEMLSLSPNANLNPLAWIESLNNYFYQAAAVPQIILGGTGAITEAAVKIAYLAFQQTIEEDQLFIEEQMLAQLNLLLDLEFPASLENELISDKKKDVTNGATQPNDTTAGVGQ